MGDDDEPPPIVEALAERAKALGAGRWPEVVADIGAGRGFAAHDKLLRLRKAARSESERKAIDAVLADRRLFVEWTDGAPKLGRLNGFGAGMYGRAAYDPDDGTYVKTRSVSGFWIPVFPIDQWLVQDAEGGGWYFLKRVPLNLGMRRARMAAIALAVCIAAVVFAVSWWSSSHVDLHLVNGLDAVAEVTIDDEPPRRLEPRAQTAMTVGLGRHHFRCTVGGRVVDERDETVRSSTAFVAYNVAGAAPITIEDVTYYRDGRASRDLGGPVGAMFELHAGSVFIHASAVAYVFKQPPETVSLRRGSDRVTHRHASLPQGGWRAAISIAMELGQDVKAADIAEAVALAQPDDDAARDEAIVISKSIRSDAEHQLFVTKLAAARTR